MEASFPTPHRPALARKPTRAETSRANGARSLGPATPEGKARSSRDALAHGLRARSLTPVAALGETRAVIDAHLAAYRREFSAPGPYARDLAEAVACAQLRAARAERLEAQLLAQAVEEGSDLAAPGTRAAWALVLRYRREAELSAKRARQELEALARARAAGLLPDEDEAAAAAAEVELDAALADTSPNEPCPAGPWHKAGAPTPCTGWARGVGGRNEPRARARLLARSRPALF